MDPNQPVSKANKEKELLPFCEKPVFRTVETAKELIQKA
jgi:hypothetical protein